MSEEGSPPHDNGKEVETPEENVKRKADSTGESPELKKSRRESESSKNSEASDTSTDSGSSSGEEETSERSPERSRAKEKSPTPKKETTRRDESSRKRRRSPSSSPDRKVSPERRRRSRSPNNRRRSRTPETRRRSRTPETRRRSRTPETRRRSRSPVTRRRSRSPEIKRRRDDRRDRDRSRSKDRNRNAESSRKDKRSPDRRAQDEEETEDGEVEEAPIVMTLTKRELERFELMRQLEAEEALENELELQEAKMDAVNQVRSCPYLDTINRSVLDFDFEKLCSVSLSTMNVYACMVCGKYYQGRGQNTHAYTHSLDTDHRVFLNLQTLKFYCLPDNYEVQDPSLDDIKVDYLNFIFCCLFQYVLNPTYTKVLIQTLDKQTKMCRAFDDSAYFPGIVGLNNIKANDYCNVILHAFSMVIPLRNYFLQEENYLTIRRPPGDTLFELPKRFGELMRKLWNPRAFRKHVSPHEMLQAAVHCSQKRFQITEQSDAADFMTFLLNTLHNALNGNQKTSSSIIYRTFRGRMRQYSRPIPPADCTEEQAVHFASLPQYREVTKDFPFLYLSMDLPPPPLYRDSQMENVIPQVPLTALLSKFNGSTEKEYKTYKDNIMKRFEILRLPEYLVVTYKRFTKNQFFMEKNPTIVNFPITNVDMYDCLAPEIRAEHKFTTYDLIANIVHDGSPEEGTYRAQILHQGSQKWFQMEDLHVEEILPQVIVLAEAYIQVWRLNRKLTREQRMNEDEDEVVQSIPGISLSNPFNPQLPAKVQQADVQ